MTFEELLKLPPYSLEQTRKEEILRERLGELTEIHRERCPAYRRLLGLAYPGYSSPRTLADVPYLPVSLFKTHRLSSVPDAEVAVVLT